MMRMLLALLALLAPAALHSPQAQEKPPTVYADDAALFKDLAPRLRKIEAAPPGGSYFPPTLTPGRQYAFCAQKQRNWLVPTTPGGRNIELENVEGAYCNLVTAAPDVSWLALAFRHPETRELTLSFWRIDTGAAKAEHFAFHTLKGEHRAGAAFDADKMMISTFSATKLVKVDAAQKKLEVHDLKLPENFVPYSSAYHERPLLIEQKQDHFSYRAARLVEKDGAFSLEPGLEVAITAKYALQILFSPDGGKCLAWNLFETCRVFEAGENAKLLGTAGRCDGAAFSPDGGRIVALGLDGVVAEFDGKHHATDGVPLRKLWPRIARASGGALSPDGNHFMVFDRDRNRHFVPVGWPEPLSATVCGQPFTWEAPRLAPQRMEWPSLEIESRFSYGANGAHSLDFAVRNNGKFTAWQVAVELSARWDATDTAALHTAWLGTLEPGQTRRRSLVLSDEQLKKRGCTLTLATQELFGFAPAPRSWPVLPRRTFTEAAYHEVAKTVFEAAVECMRELRNIPDYSPKLVKTEVGFTVSGRARAVIGYQNLYQLDAEGARINRDVMQVTETEEFMRHGEMFLYWFLPHEIAHTADSFSGWKSEYSANSIQPFLTALVLAKLKDAPYSAWFMARVYEHYRQVLAAFAQPEEERNIDAYIRSGGDTAPSELRAFDFFLTQTRQYVYIGVRVSLSAMAKFDSAKAAMDEVLK